MRTSPAPAYLGVIVNDILRDYPRSLEAEWTMKQLPTLPERDTITLTLGSGYEDLTQ